MVPMLSLVFDSHMTKHEAHVGSHVAAKQGDTRDTATVALQLFLTSLSFRARGGGSERLVQVLLKFASSRPSPRLAEALEVAFAVDMTTTWVADAWN